MNSPQPPATTEAKPLRVLYVEDEPEMRLVVAEVLRSAGHLVETASDGAEDLRRLTEALEQLKTPFNLLITDLDMPVIDGIALIQALRASRIEIKVVVYAGGLTPAKIKSLNFLSVDGVIEKGCSLHELLETVSKTVSKRGEP